MKLPVLAASVLLISAGSALAAPGQYGHGQGRWHGQGRISPYERAMIADARAHLSFVRARAWRDGRVTFLERYQIRLAEQRLERVIRRSRRG